MRFTAGIVERRSTIEREQYTWDSRSHNEEPGERNNQSRGRGDESRNERKSYRETEEEKSTDVSARIQWATVARSVPSNNAGSRIQLTIRAANVGAPDVR